MNQEAEIPASQNGISIWLHQLVNEKIPGG